MNKRIVKAASARKKEILDAAEALFFDRGYDAVSVQSIIDRVGISKGAFYHHFRSKTDILEGLAMHLSEQVWTLLTPIAETTAMPAPQRLQLLLATAQGIKKAQGPLMRHLTRMLYKPENLKLRTALETRGKAMAAPVFARVIAEGVEEGSIKSADPTASADIMLTLGQRFVAMLAEAMLAGDADIDALISHSQAYNDAINRSLGLPDDTIVLIDPALVRVMFADDTHH